ncbi:tripartite tricarboxylate transporter TctB family protein [Micromonospora pisi]|uniref:Tripartite tricarboxylate transporter TctB family protein n=1 Tax=Micromonospora pisi TaxID=589240 RepID=A0A495JBU6_9ACTN|nr:tripartite tricarboxylate transporter TctB family protein [Micromonospora pisi]RKR85864.1 tripartite tricarboxylate transporter TctB family protein [Micromonospora pisi]
MSRLDHEEAATPTPGNSPDAVDLAETEIPPAGPLGQLVASVVPVALGAAALAYAVSLGLGTPTEAGPGLWPALASLLLIAAGGWSLVFERRRQEAEQFSRGAVGIAVGIASLVVFVLLISRIGFEIPTLLIMGLWLKVLGREPWLTTIVVSVVTTATLYLLFITLLGVPLPRLAF